VARHHLTPTERERFLALTTLRVCATHNTVHVAADFDRDGACRHGWRSSEQVEEDRRWVKDVRRRIRIGGHIPNLTVVRR
jgi:hypothetical protein